MILTPNTTVGLLLITIFTAAANVGGGGGDIEATETEDH